MGRRAVSVFVLLLGLAVGWMLTERDPGASDVVHLEGARGEPAPIRDHGLTSEMQSPCVDPTSESPLPRLDRLAPVTVDSILTELAASSFDVRLWRLIASRIGVRYALGTLGEEAGSDTDPIFRLDEADCTVLVLTTTALAHSASLDEARDWMGPANYHRQGDDYPATYENRLHFTSDRLRGSPLFEDITADVASAASLQRIELVLNRTAEGKELLELGWERALELDFVPAERLESVLDRMPLVGGIAFVRLSMVPKGLAVAHEGFLLGQRCLVHASSTAGEVVAVDVIDYVMRRDHDDLEKRGAPLFDGAILYSVRDASGDVSLD